MCPEYNSKVGKIDVFRCQSEQKNCPNTIFWSNAVYLCMYDYTFKYVLCYLRSNNCFIIPLWSDVHVVRPSQVKISYIFNLSYWCVCVKYFIVISKLIYNLMIYTIDGNVCYYMYLIVFIFNSKYCCRSCMFWLLQTYNTDIY